MGKLTLALLCLPALALGGSRLRYITAGPMLHWNFGEGKSAFSVAVEAAYWDYPPGQPLYDGSAELPGDGEIGFGLDAGVEWEGRLLRIYAEPQLGMLPAGISAGPVLEWNRTSDDLHIGAQASVWANPVFAGADLRLRKIRGGTWFCPGVNGKIPIPL